MVDSRQSLAHAKRQASIGHVLTTARRDVMANGLNTTMDHIAEASGVSRRTLFRLFGTREQLIAAAFSAAMATYSQEMPPFAGDLQRWLRATCNGAHRRNAAVGPGYWELTSRSDLPPDLAETERRRRAGRRASAGEVSRMVWSANGGEGDPPDALVASVGAHLSAHFTAAVLTDVGGGWRVAADLAYEGILDALRRLTAIAVNG